MLCQRASSRYPLVLRQRTGDRAYSNFEGRHRTLQSATRFCKETDSRAKSFIAKYGDEAVELDALPAAVLRDRLVEGVRAHMDLEALEEVREQDKKDQPASRER